MICLSSPRGSDSHTLNFAKKRWEFIFQAETPVPGNPLLYFTVNLISLQSPQLREIGGINFKLAVSVPHFYLMENQVSNIIYRITGSSYILLWRWIETEFGREEKTPFANTFSRWRIEGTIVVLPANRFKGPPQKFKAHTLFFLCLTWFSNLHCLNVTIENAWQPC
jgi:hypothetical protein